MVRKYRTTLRRSVRNSLTCLSLHKRLGKYLQEQSNQEEEAGTPDIFPRPWRHGLICSVIIYDHQAPLPYISPSPAAKCQYSGERHAANNCVRERRVCQYNRTRHIQRDHHRKIFPLILALLFIIFLLRNWRHFEIDIKQQYFLIYKCIHYMN